MSIEGQGKAKARSRRGQSKFKVRSRQRKHNLNRNFNLMGFDTIEINQVKLQNWGEWIKTPENSREKN